MCQLKTKLFCFLRFFKKQFYSPRSWRPSRPHRMEVKIKEAGMAGGEKQQFLIIRLVPVSQGDNLSWGNLDLPLQACTVSPLPPVFSACASSLSHKWYHCLTSFVSPQSYKVMVGAQDIKDGKAPHPLLGMWLMPNKLEAVVNDKWLLATIKQTSS